MINDLKVSDLPSWKFVDDTTTSKVVPVNSSSQAQRSVDIVVNWSLQNRLQLNGDKCKEMVIDFKRQKHHLDRLTIEGKPIEVVHHAKILGLTVSDKLLWNDHVNNAIKKVNKRLFFLVQLKRARVHATDIINFYCACIRPVLEYGAQVFHYALPEYLQKNLERVQKCALSFIFPGITYEERLELSNVDTLSTRRQNLCDSLFRSTLTDSNHKLHHILPKTNIPHHNLRYNRAYELPFIGTNRFKNTFVPSCSKRRQYLYF